LQEDLSPHLPKIRVPRNAHIPSVWEKEEIANLLSAVNRKSAKGKRDYVILLMAYRLGLRSIDIRRLCLEDIDWIKSEIRIVQSKTRNPLVLPLIEECGEALIDYLQNGRPKSDSRHVFLISIAPYGPIKQHCTLHKIITFYRRKAGVTKPRNGNRGMHSLRHTFASRLLERNISMETISELLGHVSIESTNIYTKVNTQALRTAALDPEDLEIKEVDHE
jgi:integrase